MTASGLGGRVGQDGTEVGVEAEGGGGLAESDDDGGLVGAAGEVQVTGESREAGRATRLEVLATEGGDEPTERLLRLGDGCGVSRLANKDGAPHPEAAHAKREEGACEDGGEDRLVHTVGEDDAGERAVDPVEGGVGDVGAADLVEGRNQGTEVPTKRGEPAKLGVTGILKREAEERVEDDPVERLIFWLGGGLVAIEDHRLCESPF